MADLAREVAGRERVLFDLHPHWRRLVVPFVCVPLVAGLATAGVLSVPSGGPGRLGVIVVALLLGTLASGLPYLRWRTTRYLVTEHRVIGQAGILTRVGHEVELWQLVDVRAERSLLDRLTRTGDLVLEGDDEEGDLRLVAVPGVSRVQRTVEALIEASEGWEQAQQPEDDAPDEPDRVDRRR